LTFNRKVGRKLLPSFFLVSPLPAAISLHRDSDENRNPRAAVGNRSHELVNSFYSLFKMYVYDKRHLFKSALQALGV
jgi:hypothetical protein